MYAPKTVEAMVEAGTHSYQPVEVAAAPEPPSGKSITEMTKAELLVVAQAMGITADDKMTKANLLDLIAAGS